MEISDWKSTAELNPVYREIRKQGLETNLAEFETYGFTVIEPERFAPPEFLERLRRALLDVAERRTGIKHDLVTGAHGSLDQEPSFKHQYVLYYMLLEDPVFQEYVTNPTLMTIMTYLLGFDFKLYVLASFVKWPQPGGDGRPPWLHMDSPVSPLSLTAGKDAHGCNSVFLLTDYTRENGGIAFVPGSHRYCRPPAFGEGLENAIPVEAPAGSVVLWHANLWHGGVQRTAPGLRLNLTGFFTRRYIVPQENYRDNITQEILDRNSKRLAVLVGMGDENGWTSAQGPRRSKSFKVLIDAYQEAGYPLPAQLAQYRDSGRMHPMDDPEP